MKGDHDGQAGGQRIQSFAAAWPAMEETAGEFGKRMNTMPKVVVSTTLTEPTWNNTTIISRPGASQGRKTLAGGPAITAAASPDDVAATMRGRAR